MEKLILTSRRAIGATIPAKGDLQHKLACIVQGLEMPAKPFCITNQKFCLADIMEGFVQTYSE